jgi:23S rRNA (cytosine1962-C5)-methyltransferase
MSAEMIRALEQAWKARLSSGQLERIHESALRLFYGPGEVHPRDPLASWAIDGYGGYLWITEWEGESTPASVEEIREASRGFYSGVGYRGAVVLRRPRQGIPEMPQLLWGETPPSRFTVLERFGEHSMSFEIQLLEGRHPGLFLDHAPLRRWLSCSGKLSGKKVLNTFAYTGSLSVASWMGGASEVVTLDLSRPTTQWAERNGRMNGIPVEKSRYIYGDFFEEVPRFARRGDSYDVVISDPPSFSRGKKRTFSTQKDLVDLHELLLSVLKPGGILVTSINSANVPWEKYERDVQQAARKLGRKLKLLARIEQPESFPSHPANPKSRYLKGFIFEA